MFCPYGTEAKHEANGSANGHRHCSTAPATERLRIMHGIRVCTLVTIAGIMMLAEKTWAGPPPLRPDECGTGQGFGQALAVSPRWLFVGAPLDSRNGPETGAVYMYEFVGGEWQPRQRLTPQHVSSLERFGSSIAMLDDLAVVGSAPTLTTSGPVFAYRFDSGAWIEEPVSMRVPPPRTGTGLDVAVAIGGTEGQYRIVVGIPSSDWPIVGFSGEVRILLHNGPLWEVWQSVGPPENNLLDERFGSAVAAYRNTFFVGAPAEGPTNIGPGAVYLLDANPVTGYWEIENELLAPDGRTGDAFGGALAHRPGSLLIGAPGDDQPGAASQFEDIGAAYLFVEGPGPWHFEQKLASPDGREGDRFGHSVALGGDTALVGAPGADDGGMDSGAAYVFRRCAGGWSFIRKLSAPDAGSFDRFGFAVGLQGGEAQVGAPSMETACPSEPVPTVGQVHLFDVRVSDCNENGIDDEIEVAKGLRPDCNENCLPDECDLPLLCPWCEDCNANGVPDECDAASGHDCNENEKPDECEVPPLCESCGDCNVNHVPDVCDLASGASVDCNANATPDECEVPPGCPECRDCNRNGSPDACDLNNATSLDCNFNAVPDECETGPTCTHCLDCNDNGVPDDCDVASGTSYDCDGNGLLDECEWDCDGNGLADVCDHRARIIRTERSFYNNFGRAVAVFGNVAVVGAALAIRPNDYLPAGAAYIFRRDPATGRWNQEQKLEPANGELGDHFGWAVAITENVIVIGSPRNENALDQRGSVYVYQSNGTEWVQTQILTPPYSVPAYEEFGYDIAIGTYGLLVGAPEFDINSEATGKVYHYAWDGTGFVYRQVLLPWFPGSTSAFGASVAVHGTRCLIGAPYGNGPNGATGAVYAFRFDGRDWLPWQQLAPQGETHYSFGAALSMYNDRALIGAWESGYFYELSGETWVEVQRIGRLPGVLAHPHSPFTAMHGDWAFIGAPSDVENRPRIGAVYVFHRDETQWRELRKIIGPRGAPARRFGFSVGASDEYFVAGTPDERNWLDAPSTGPIGTAYAYRLEPPVVGDADWNGVRSLPDMDRLTRCLTGPPADGVATQPPFACVATFDFDHDEDVDLADVADFQRAFGCPDE